VRQLVVKDGMLRIDPFVIHDIPGAENLKKRLLECCFNELATTQLAMHEMLKRRQLWQTYVTPSGMIATSPPDAVLLLQYLPLDQNIAGEVLTQLFERYGIAEWAKAIG